MEINSREFDSAFNKLFIKLGPVFSNDVGYKNAQKYVRGLFGTVGRKNNWQISEYLGESTPYSMQQMLYRGRFSSDAMRDVLRGYVSEEIGEKDGTLVIDETGFLKQGKKSCGVQRQYSGTAGRIENCQIGVFLTYASNKGHCPIDRRLYMPEDWMKDPERRKGAGVPESLEFQTKPQMALEMVQDATVTEVPYIWVTGDCVYGDYTELRSWLEEHKKSYVLSVSGKAYVWIGTHQERVGDILKDLPATGWFEASCGDGSKGARVYDWLILEINPGMTMGFKRFLMIRRSKSAPDELRAYICFGSVDEPAQKYIEIAGTRWTVETCFKESKSEVGLDQYEVRSYEGWYKHITFACIALALLTVISGHSLDGQSTQEHNPAESSLEEFKKKRNLRV